MEYILHDFKDKNLLTRHIYLGPLGHASLSKHVLYLSDFIYILPAQIGHYRMRNLEFIRDQSMLKVRIHESQ